MLVTVWVRTVTKYRRTSVLNVCSVSVGSRSRSRNPKFRERLTCVVLGLSDVLPGPSLVVAKLVGSENLLYVCSRKCPTKTPGQLDLASTLVVWSGSGWQNPSAPSRGVTSEMAWHPLLAHTK